jgi:cyclin-dependent kinase
MANGRPLFAGTSESDQLDRIFRMLGTPSLAEYPGIVDLPEYCSSDDNTNNNNNNNLPVYPKPKNGLASLVPSLNPTGIDLLSRMLQYDPARRITAQQALEHEFFRDMTGNNNNNR